MDDGAGARDDASDHATDGARAADDAVDGAAAENDASSAVDQRDAAATAESGDVVARYFETDEERVLAFRRTGDDPAGDGSRTGDATAAVAQNREGYAMLKVRRSPEGDELERYYGFDVALDHVAELLEVRVRDLPVPDPATDMGM